MSLYTSFVLKYSTYVVISAIIKKINEQKTFLYIIILKKCNINLNMKRQKTTQYFTMNMKVITQQRIQI